MQRRKFLKHTSLASLGILACPSYSSAFSYNNYKDVIVGHNSHQYKVDLNWGNLNPLQTPVKDCHEIVQDSKGRIVLLTNHTKNNIIIYDKSGKFITSWGTKYPGGHGLTLVKENGEDFLLITDYERHQVIKTTIDGKVVFELNYPAETGLYKNKEAYKPTETTVTENGDFKVIFVNTPYDDIKKETNRVFKNFPRITPGWYNNHSIEMKFVLPVRFPITTNTTELNFTKKDNVKEEKKNLFDVVEKNRIADSTFCHVPDISGRQSFMPRIA